MISKTAYLCWTENQLKAIKDKSQYKCLLNSSVYHIMGNSVTYSSKFQ